MGREYTAEQIEKAKLDRKVSSLNCVTVGEDEYYFANPTKQQYAIFNKTLFDEDTRHTAVSNLVLDCMVLPSREEFKKELEESPGLADSIGRRVVDAATKGKPSEAKKV